MEIQSINLNYFFGVNCYLLKTEFGYFLIDTGITKTRDELEKALNEAGCKLGDLKLIILTHGHTDHVGNAVYLRDKYGAKIAMHCGDLRMVETGDMFVDMKGGIMMGLVGSLMKAFGLASEKFTPDIYLEDNQSLKEYGLDAIVIHNPGHSEGSISLLTDDGLLFCGDLFNNDKKPMKASIIQNAEMLDASVEQIKAIDTSTIYPGHGKPFTMDQLE
ncbi:MBL fold metallo-hydrolase [Candidatus Bathyarchaeota archaeon]|nr:MAG: MBL fold metallo-hydrolase [Candidatus Bathyarchaeota archaeon]